MTTRGGKKAPGFSKRLWTVFLCRRVVQFFPGELKMQMEIEITIPLRVS
jgi:hypothetical protein